MGERKDKGKREDRESQLKRMREEQDHVLRHFPPPMYGNYDHFAFPLVNGVDVHGQYYRETGGYGQVPYTASAPFVHQQQKLAKVHPSRVFGSYLLSDHYQYIQSKTNKMYHNPQARITQGHASSGTSAGAAASSSSTRGASTEPGDNNNKAMARPRKEEEKRVLYENVKRGFHQRYPHQSYVNSPSYRRQHPEHFAQVSSIQDVSSPVKRGMQPETTPTPHTPQTPASAVGRGTPK